MYFNSRYSSNPSFSVAPIKYAPFLSTFISLESDACLSMCGPLLHPPAKLMLPSFVAIVVEYAILRRRGVHYVRPHK
jgi:hypothetical protein